MGSLVKNKNLNYWLCGLVFTILAWLAGVAVGVLGIIPYIGIIIWVILMPWVTGWLVDYVSDKWMD